MLTQFGLEPERTRLEWVSASEGDHFAKLADEFTETIRGLGPLDWKGGLERLAEETAP
jgi:F420-non-reducing hydrogenase iron-sulfur subunit